jgi:uncharacterized membrane protein
MTTYHHGRISRWLIYAVLAGAFVADLIWFHWIQAFVIGLSMLIASAVAVFIIPQGAN